MKELTEQQKLSAMQRHKIRNSISGIDDSVESLPKLSDTERCNYFSCDINYSIPDADTKESFLYRDHRGSLNASMATVQEMRSHQNLIDHLSLKYGAGDVVCEYYARDPRINWDSYIITHNGNAVGFTNKLIRNAAVDYATIRLEVVDVYEEMGVAIDLGMQGNCEANP